MANFAMRKTTPAVKPAQWKFAANGGDENFA
jgi:hypothetical protein